MLQISDAMLHTSTALVCNGNSDRTAVCEHFIILEKGALVKYIPPGTERGCMVKNTGDENSLSHGMPSTPTQCASVQSEESSNPPQPPPEIPRDNNVNIEAVNGKSETSGMLSTTNSEESEKGTENSTNNSENSLLCCCSISITKYIRNTCPCLKPVLWDEDTEPCCCCCPRRNEDVTRWCCCSCWNWDIFYKETLKLPVIIHGLSFERGIKFQWWDFIFGVLGIGLYVLDVVTDLWLAYTLFSQGHVVYFSTTLVFVLLAYIVNGFMTLHVHKFYGVFNGKQWILVIAAVLFNMGPCIDTAVYLYYGCKSRQTGLSSEERKSYVEKTKEHREWSCILRMFEGCLESAPQLVFQLYLLVLMSEIHGTEGVMRVLSVLSSWFSLSLTVATHNKALHNNTDYNTRHMIFDCLRRMAETGSIALFTSVFRYWVLAFLVPHVVIVFIWDCYKRRHFSIFNLIFSLLFACFSLFLFWPQLLMKGDTDNGRTRIYYFIFYVFFHGENVAMLLLWYLYAEGPVDWVRPWGLVVGLVFLPLHVGLLLLYYGLCHPKSENTRDNRLAQWCDKNVWKAAMC